MQNMKRMKNISGFISKAAILLFAMALFLPVSGQDSVRVSGQESVQVSGKDTLRTFGPRFGIDLARFFYLLADPSEVGAEFSVDFEIYKNIYPVFELGYNSISDSQELFDYSSAGSYGRVGLDYNFLKPKDRSVHHAITLGFRYAMSVFKHDITNIVVPGDYWGDYLPGPYENNLTGHWVELVGGMKAEVLPNFFLGWSFRYKILLNPEMDPIIIPELIPGYGTGGKERTFGFTYSVYYMIPLIKK
jgi:hypothetical protein